MEYALKTDEAIDQGIRRIYDACLQETIAALSPPYADIQESIHNSRKSFKFMRALIRLIKYPLGMDLYEKENLFFRDRGRQVSELRDIHVMIIILQYVASEAHSVGPEDIESGLKELQKREDRLLKPVFNKEKKFEKISSDLQAAVKNFEQLPTITAALKELLSGLKEVYGKGREHFLEVQDNPEKDHFHEWRKQVKYLLHHYQILENYWPKSLNINGTSLQQLSEYLGEEHDLALFDDLIKEGKFRKKLSSAESLQGCVDQKRTFLQRSALNLGSFIYTKPEEEFISHFE